MTAAKGTTTARARRRSAGEGSVYFVDWKNRWVGAISVGGHRRTVVAKTETAARRRLDALRLTLAAGTPVGDANVTVGEVLKRWSERTLAARDLAPTTLVGYHWCVARLTDELGRRRVHLLTADHVEAAFDKMAVGDDEHRACGRSALVKMRSVLAQALDFAVRRGLVARNVGRIAELTPTATRPKARRSLTAAEARKLLAALEEHRLRAMFIIMLTTGLRPGEAAGLMWDAIDIDKGRVAVRSAVRVERNRPVVVGSLKTSRSRRTLDLAPFAAAALREHQHEQRVERLAAKSWADVRLVFTTGVGTPLNPRNVARDFAKITEAAGLGTWTPNELRHSAASLLSDSGMPLEHVADQLGHSTTRMLEQVYRHSVQPSLTAAAAAMEDLLGG